MSAGVIGLLFTFLHFRRTFLGLCELHCFQQWAISCLRSIDSLKSCTEKLDENSTEPVIGERLKSNKEYYDLIDKIRVNELIIENRI